VIRPGQILIAHPELKCNTFANSVVLVTEKSSKGHTGLMLNKPSNISMRDIADEKGWSWPYDDRLFRGGPVSPSALIMLHSSEWYSSNTMLISDIASLSSDNFMTEKMVMGNSPVQWRMVHGLAGWFPGQLEQEIKRNDWLTAWPTEDILFEYTGEEQWRRSITLCANQAVDAFF
jgi:putative transcriptional regulator